MAKTYEISFKLGAQMAGNFAKTMSSASGALGQLNNTIGKMSQQQNSLNSLIKLRNQVAETSREYSQARERVAKLGREMAQTQNPSKELTKEFAKAQRQVTQTKSKLEEKRAALKQLNTTMGTTGQSTKQLVQRQEELEQSAERARKAQASLQKTMSAQQADLERRGELRGQLFDAAAIGASVAVFTAGAREIQKAQGELATLSVSEKGLGAITQMGMKMSNQFAGVTVPDFIRASYDIRSGIESISEVAVGKFTEMAAMTAAATKSTTGEMTNLFAKGYGIYRQQFDQFANGTIEGWENLSAEERDIKFGESFSAGISAAVKQFRTDGAEMSAALSNLGKNATTMGHSMEDQIATLGALQKTMSGSEAATKYRAFLRGATKAQDKLGLSFVDSNGKLKSTQEILKEIQKSYGGNLTAENISEISTAFGGDEAGSFIASLIGDLDSLEQGANNVAESMRRGAKATEEMAKAGQKGREFELLQQRLQNASSAISQGLLPAILPATEWLGKMAMWVGNAAQEYPFLTKVIGVTVVGLAALKVAAIAGAYAGTFFTGAYHTVAKVLKTARVAYLLHTGALVAGEKVTKGAIITSKLFTAAQWLQNKAVAGAKWVWATGKMVAYKTMQASLSVATKAFTAAQWLQNAAIVGAKWVWAIGKMVAFKAVQIGMAIATKAMTAAQWLFNAALMANPIGLIIGAIGALISVGILLYKNWDKVTKFASTAWDAMKNYTAKAINWVTNLLKNFSPMAWISKAFTAAKNWISGFSLKGVSDKVIKGVKWAFMNLTPIGWTIQAFSKAKAWLSGFSLKGMSDKVIKGVKWAFMNLTPIGWTIQAFSKAKEWLSGFSLSGVAKSIVGGVKSSFKYLNPVNWVIAAFNRAKSWLSSFSLFNSGKKILQTLANGIRSAIGSVVGTVKNAFAKVRSYLPFSDAKVGPLSDLTASGSAIMKTIGQGMQKAGPKTLTNPFSSMAGKFMQDYQSDGFKGAITSTVAPSTTQAIDSKGMIGALNPANLLKSLGSLSGSGGGSTTVTLQVDQHITIGAGAGGDVEQQARRGASQGAEDMLQQLQKALGREKRLSYV